ncbi:hypothetical protein [Phyllobacterium phragmitis]|uniref:hypothetical protein n=1 Tax=Phyllobacterium phragmitis TaxID=2670329 RepID=UPI00161D67D4
MNLDHGIRASLPRLDIEYGDNFTSVENNSHTVLVTAGKGNQLVVDGEHYNLIQCRFHHPGEHLLKGTLSARMPFRPSPR